MAYCVKFDPEHSSSSQIVGREPLTLMTTNPIKQIKEKNLQRILQLFKDKNLQRWIVFDMILNTVQKVNKMRGSP